MVLDKRPIYSLSFEGGTSKLSFNGAKVTLMCSIVLGGLVFLNVISSCMFSISCGRFLPTVSFVGTLISHDKIQIIASIFCFVVCQLVAVAVLTGLRKGLSCFDRAFMYLAITLFSGLLICASVVDEVNGFLIMPMAGFHVFYSLSALVVGCAWLYFVLDAFSNSRLKGSLWLLVMKKLSIVLGVLATVTVLEWLFASSVYWNILINENVEAVCEWALLALAIAVPAVLVKALPEFRVSLSLQCV